jgi:hypothetical protein
LLGFQYELRWKEGLGGKKCGEEKTTKLWVPYCFACVIFFTSCWISNINGDGKATNVLTGETQDLWVNEGFFRLTKVMRPECTNGVK